ncbi:hypothetical protein PT974_08036 [Cladobotryum mycophilum]|uniref:Uncharacterized protein n=1 Tax=Cladobotryum mycophilum TaxID=491253 RepID=A0ABR0SDA9_9HYPO
MSSILVTLAIPSVVNYIFGDSRVSKMGRLGGVGANRVFGSLADGPTDNPDPVCLFAPHGSVSQHWMRLAKEWPGTRGMTRHKRKSWIQEE